MRKNSVQQIAGILAGCFLITGLLAGCGATADSGAQSSSTSSQSTNVAVGVNSFAAASEPTKEELGQHIKTSGAVLENGKLAVFATNENEVPVDMDIKVEFYDENEAPVGSGEKYLYAVGQTAEVAAEIFSTPEAFQTYKIYVDAEAADNTAHFDQISLTHNNTGKEVVVQATNNFSDTIDYMTVSVVYYRGETPVGISESSDSQIDAGRAGNFTLRYPYDKKYKDVAFDSYKVFLTQAYSY